MDDLVERDGLDYEKFTDVPFTGKVTGNPQGSYKNGKRDGAWVGYHETGQLGYKGNYKDAERDGDWVQYDENGQLWWKGNFKTGKEEGAWVYYHNGQLATEGNYKNGKKKGFWISYNTNGTVFKPMTGIYKGGMKISD